MENNCNWEEIEAFRSFSEFERFSEWIGAQVVENMVSEVQVEDFYGGIGFKERWFQCLSSKSIWRLVYPDGPFHGYWGEVIQKA